jgi:hypothetical protein
MRQDKDKDKEQDKDKDKGETRQNKTKTRQDNTRQDKIRQDKTRRGDPGKVYIFFLPPFLPSQSEDIFHLILRLGLGLLLGLGFEL